MSSELKNIKLEADGEFVSFAGTDDVICSIASGSYDNDDKLAMLFAAAPELLDTLIEIVEMQSKYHGNGMNTHIQLANLAKKARVVIAKATGAKQTIVTCHAR
nr:hypothetical protein [Providencia rettgeri]